MKLIVISILAVLGLFATVNQSPHGEKFDMDCAQCHTAKDWVIDKSAMTFDHNKTSFVLEGQHKAVECRACHSTLVFAEANTECFECHKDMHNQTVGLDCNRCHNSETWIIGNVRDIHVQSRFPLLGAHAVADCAGCHTSASNLQFEALSLDCYGCHSDKYLATTKPDHLQAGYSTDCIECHTERANEWSATGFNHDFFPLTGGHGITNCALCHGEGKYEKVATNCFDCHSQDYSNASNPNHTQSGFSTNCTDCHTINPNWQPAQLKQHDSQFFPIYSGRHKNAWNSCSDCHSDAGNYTSFSCLDCHEHRKAAMDRAHGNRNGYSYTSTACYSCHPRGNSGD